MKKIVLALFAMVVYSHALECTFESMDGMIFKTMTSTYSEKDNIKSMWFEFKKTAKKKIIATGKDKIEFLDDKYRLTQYVEYDPKGNVKMHFKATIIDEYEEPIPNSVGEWKMNMVKTGAYLLDDVKKEDEKSVCAIFATGWIPTQDDGTVIPPLHLQR